MDHQELLRQLGGSRFKTMTGAKNFTAGKNDLTFRIGGGAQHRINSVKITLAANDTYTIEFYRIQRGRMALTDTPEQAMAKMVKLVEKVEEVYCDSLQNVFTRVTGFHTHL